MPGTIRTTFKGPEHGGTVVGAKGLGQGCEEAVKAFAKDVGMALYGITHTDEYFRQERDLTNKEREVEP